MAGVKFYDNERTAPIWAADALDGDGVMPLGLKLDPAQFLATDAVPVTVGPAGAAIGATTIPVDALAGAIPAGEFLNFGALAPVIVTVNDGAVAAGDIALTVLALSGPIPAGTVLDFGGGTNAQLAKLSAAAAQGATSLTVLPLDGTIANASVATFPGGTRQARVTSPAAAAATSITVDELQFALADNDTATYVGSGMKLKSLPSGTPVGRTLAEQASDAMWGPADEDDDFIYLIPFPVPNLDENNDAEAYRPGKIVKYNKLQTWSTLDAGVQGRLREIYICIKGAA